MDKQPTTDNTKAHNTREKGKKRKGREIGERDRGEETKHCTQTLIFTRTLHTNTYIYADTSHKHLYLRGHFISKLYF